jgi:SAM-dependent methyltransferase
VNQPSTKTQPQDAAQGAAVYNRAVLAAYDAFVVGLSNSVAWKCPSRLLVEFYNENVSAEHLDVGVGTGYFLDKCRFPVSSPRLTLVDLNPNCLRATARRVRRHHPSYALAGTHLANALGPLDLGEGKFGSIGVNYLLHCLPGALSSGDPTSGDQTSGDQASGDQASKGALFRNLKPWLRPGGVLFGATILGAGVEHGFLARKLMDVYNAKGIFSNRSDSAEGLRAALGQHFEVASLRVVGCVALFSARGFGPA